MPSLTTCTNLGAGVFACAFAVEGAVGLGALMIIVAVLLDSVDGALARRLDVASDFGGHLDSLADVISFGVAPAVVVGVLVPEEFEFLGWGLVTLFPVCSAWRLARFNVQSQPSGMEHADFTGLPTTGAGGAAAAAVLVHLSLADQGFTLGVSALPPFLLLLAFLMVSRFPYKHIGSLLSRIPLSIALMWCAVLMAAALLWHHEVIFAVVFWAYALSGPAATVGEKIMASHQAGP